MKKECAVIGAHHGHISEGRWDEEGTFRSHELNSKKKEWAQWMRAVPVSTSNMVSMTTLP